VTGPTNFRCAVGLAYWRGGPRRQCVDAGADGRLGGGRPAGGGRAVQVVMNNLVAQTRKVPALGSQDCLPRCSKALAGARANR